MGKRPEMWQCNECGSCWSESKAKICYSCSSNDIFVFWKPGTVPFNVDDYAVAPQMLPARTPAKAADVEKIATDKPVIVPNKKKSRQKKGSSGLRNGRRSPASPPKPKSKRRRDANAPLEVSKLREDLKPSTGKLTDIF